MGDTIRALRIKAKMSIAQLSQKSGIKPRVICSWERGERVPRVDKAKTLAEALGVRIDEILR